MSSHLLKFLKNQVFFQTSSALQFQTNFGNLDLNLALEWFSIILDLCRLVFYDGGFRLLS